MTASIFLSWGSPDKDRVLPLRDRLGDVGLKIWEYSEDMSGGADIHGDIIETINQVRLAIICFSDQTAERDWIVQEANWCFATWKAGDKPLRYIVPVWVGPHPENKVPKVLADNNFRTADLAAGGDQSLGRFIRDLFSTLGQEAPREIPAALFAMTDAECKLLLGQSGAKRALRDLCVAAGMRPPPPIHEALLGRYGNRREDLAPFKAGQPLLATINKTLREVNQTRVAQKKRPLFLRWMYDELVGAAASREARALWAAGDSLLIVDSASTLQPEIQQRLLQLPQPKRPERAALLWLPPYTQHAVSLENTLGTIAAKVAHLGDAFNDWANSTPLRSMAFDTATPAGTRLWLHRALLDVEDDPAPLRENVAAMERIAPVRIRVSDIVPQLPGE